MYKKPLGRVNNGASSLAFFNAMQGTQIVNAVLHACNVHCMLLWFTYSICYCNALTSIRMQGTAVIDLNYKDRFREKDQAYVHCKIPAQ